MWDVLEVCPRILPVQHLWRALLPFTSSGGCQEIVVGTLAGAASWREQHVNERGKSLRSQMSLPLAPRAPTSKSPVFLKAVRSVSKDKFCSRENFLLPGDIAVYFNAVYTRGEVIMGEDFPHGPSTGQWHGCRLRLD